MDRTERIEENRIPEEIAFCGVDCGACPDLAEGKCPGCRRTGWPEDDPCPPVACCGKRGIEVCGRCEDFPCQMMREFYEESDSHRAAFARMRDLRLMKRGQSARPFPCRGGHWPPVKTSPASRGGGPASRPVEGWPVQGNGQQAAWDGGCGFFASLRMTLSVGTAPCRPAFGTNAICRRQISRCSINKRIKSPCGRLLACGEPDGRVPSLQA